MSKISMPIVTHTHKGLFVYCPFKKRVVSVQDCYVCPKFIKRDADRVYCTYEISRLAGKVLEVLEKNDEVIVRTEFGIFRAYFTSNRNARKRKRPKLEVVPYEVEQIREGPHAR